jgi:UDP-4-amino-4,6-dideoxy-N-acetyl-beta-L-altrosamine N-acetyltransferase
MTRVNEGRLRPILASDLPMVLMWRNNKVIRQYMFDSRIVTVEEHSSWFENAMRDEQKEILLYEHGKDPVGFVQICHAAQSRVAEWGFYVAPIAPKGTGTLMLKQVLSHLFNLRNVFKVHAKVLEFNIVSKDLHQKLGFKEEGVFREHHFDGVDRWDVYCYGLLSTEWKP